MIFYIFLFIIQQKDWIYVREMMVIITCFNNYFH